LIPFEEYQDVNQQLLNCGADIKEVNTVRKHLSAVKGGRFAQLCAPAKIECIILSDVLGDEVDSIASGPACADSSTSEDAFHVIEKYQLKVSKKAEEVLRLETPKQIADVHTKIIGSVKILCKEAEKVCIQLGYETEVWKTDLSCEAKDAGEYFSKKAKEHYNDSKSYALIAGGETVVHVKGNGKGGRNQEMALACADGISGLKDVCFFSVGSDGTDGPTDAAGGIVTGKTKEKLAAENISLQDKLNEHDSYNALKMCDGLVITGPTGTNVNDFSVLLVKK
jgi:hydroxypyruvate reductase